MKQSRRSFLVSCAAAGAAIATGAAAEEKTVDGGYAAVSEPGRPERTHAVLPPGSGDASAFSRRCVGCQLCVKACPNKVLRPSRGRGFPRPEMGFEKGWCRPECVKCSEVCPAGAIRKIGMRDKKNIRSGRAVFRSRACIAATDGTHCTVCARHCPYGAITLVELDQGKPGGPKIPVVDEAKCTGCGACEHLCPARPMPGLAVEGYVRHKETHPVEAAVSAPAPSPVWQGLRLA